MDVLAQMVEVQAQPAQFGEVPLHLLTNPRRSVDQTHPFIRLPESQLKLLEQQPVSGIDLSGNVLIVVPHKILVRRTGAPNPFRRAGVIGNVYRKISSIVARVFLLKPQYDSIS